MFLCVCCYPSLPFKVFPGLSMEFYRTVLLQNTGALPLIYTLDQEQSPSVCVFPSCGLVHPGQHHILALRATPSEDNPPELPLTLQLNADPKHTQVHPHPHTHTHTYVTYAYM